MDLLIPYAAGFIVAWFAARMLPELCWSHRDATSTRLAVIEDRSPLRFVTPTARRWLTAALVISAGCVAWSLVRREPLTQNNVQEILSTVILATFGSLAVWRIARRSYAASTADDVLVDDAIRVFGTTAVVSSWSALQFLTLPWLIAGTGELVPESVVWLVYVAYVGMLASWAWVPTRVFARRSPVALAA